jgi:hypothetical protein
MAKKNENIVVEEEVTTNEETTKKESERWLGYYYDNIYEDEEDITLISETAIATIRERFHITLDDPRLMTSAFLKIFESFIDKLKTLQKDYDSFQINLANRLAIGFTNNENDDDEKSGNYMLFIQHLREATKTEANNDPTVSNIERAVQWNAENITDQPELIRTLTIDAVKYLRDIDIQLSNNEIIMPIFITYYESIINYLKIRRREEDLFELQLNYSWFFIGAREGDGRDVIFVRPSINGKLALKSDISASSKFE